MTIEDSAQLDELILKEINVKVLRRYICGTEKGDLCLNFSLEEREYYWTLCGKRIHPRGLEQFIPELCYGKRP